MGYLNRKKREEAALRDVIHEMALAGKHPKWAELDAKIRGLIIEKTEAKVELKIDANKRAKIHFQAVKELEEGERLLGQGVGEVLPQPAVLPDSVRLDTE